MVSGKSGYLKRSVYGQRYYSYFEAMLRSGAGTDDVDCLPSDTLASDDLWERGDDILRAALELGELVAIGIDRLTKQRAEIPSTLWSSISVLGSLGCESDYLMRLGVHNPDYYLEEISSSSSPDFPLWRSVIIEKEALRRWMRSSDLFCKMNEYSLSLQTVISGENRVGALTSADETKYQRWLEEQMRLSPEANAKRWAGRNAITMGSQPQPQSHPLRGSPSQEETSTEVEGRALAPTRPSLAVVAGAGRVAGGEGAR